MAAIGTTSARYQLPDDMIAAVKAVASFRKVDPATIIIEAVTAYLDINPRLDKAAFTAEKARELTDGYAVFQDFIERGFAALAENIALKDEAEEQRKRGIVPAEPDDFDPYEGPDFADELSPSLLPDEPFDRLKKPTF